jgi:hypothetical protein
MSPEQIESYLRTERKKLRSFKMEVIDRYRGG